MYPIDKLTANKNKGPLLYIIMNEAAATWAWLIDPSNLIYSKE